MKNTRISMENTRTSFENSQTSIKSSARAKNARVKYGTMRHDYTSSNTTHAGFERFIVVIFAGMKIKAYFCLFESRYQHKCVQRNGTTSALHMEVSLLSASAAYNFRWQGSGDYRRRPAQP